MFFQYFTQPWVAPIVTFRIFDYFIGCVLWAVYYWWIIMRSVWTVGYLELKYHRSYDRNEEKNNRG